MEATGRDDGGRGPSWSHRRRHEETGSTTSYTATSSSSRSGTIVSTTYTSGASRLSSAISMEAAALLQLDLDLDGGTSCIEESDLSILGFKSNCNWTWTLERWFSELGVSWVLQLDVGASAAWIRACERDTGSWIRALTQIVETIHLTESFFADDPVQFALFYQEAMLKMLVFVDVIFRRESLSKRGPQYISNSLVSRLDIHAALSKALSRIRFLLFHSSPPAMVEQMKETASLLSAKQGKACEAIWSALEETRTRVLSSMEDSSGTDQSPQGSSDIHEATCSVMDYIKFLLGNHLTVDPLVSQAAGLGKYVPQTGPEEAPPFISMIAEMVSSLEEKLVTKSQLFLDRSLGLLFLLNNSNFIQEQLQDLFLLNNSNFIQEQLQGTLSYIKVDLAAVISFITRKVEHYTESYIQVSWEPILACLFRPTLLRLVRKYSPLSKFESKFQKICTTQKLWKVPDPELRKRLRKAVIEKIVPGYTQYIEYCKATNPKFTPQELEGMLQELFEG